MGQTSSITRLESDLDGFSLAAFENLEMERDEIYDEQFRLIPTLQSLFLATKRIMDGLVSVGVREWICVGGSGFEQRWIRATMDSIA